MPLLSRLFSFLRHLTGREQAEQDLDEEIRSHLELLVDQKLREGMQPAEARRTAKIELGGIEQVKEQVRAARAGALLETLLRDIRFGVRMLGKNPGFTAVTVVTLALGIGATTAIFTATYATLLAPLPYPHPDRLVNVWSKFQGHRTWVSPGDFADWKRASTAFEDLNACRTNDFNIATKDTPEFLNGMEATAGYYRMLGTSLFLGRNFLPEEAQPGKGHVIILTHRLWRHLGANPNIIGTAMRVNDEPYTVVGVMAPGVADRWDWQLIVPLVFTAEELADHDSRGLLVTGRLQPGLTLHQAQAEIDSIAANEAHDYPKSDQGWGALVEPFRNDFLSSDRRTALCLLFVAVGFLLLIACINVANLVLARGITRQREVAIRGSLGAGRGAIFAQFITENLVVAMAGGTLGIGLGFGMLRGLIAVMPANSLPAEADLRFNIPILISMLAATTLAGLLFGFAPAWYASRLNPSAALKEGGRSGWVSAAAGCGGCSFWRNLLWRCPCLLQPAWRFTVSGILPMQIWVSARIMSWGSISIPRRFCAIRVREISMLTIGAFLRASQGLPACCTWPL
jgi:putative ABC transport system permease protein